MALVSTSGQFKINWTDVLKSLRTGVTVLASTFFLGVMNQLPTVLSNTESIDIKAIGTSLLIAGASAVLDLARRWLTDNTPRQ